MPKTPHIFLYGPSGSGKSTLGRILAENLGLPFVDLDGEIEARAGMPVAGIFAAEGEAGFRAREREALARVADSGGVVALGGGALLEAHNRALAEARGPIICLTAPAETLLARLQSDASPRPLLQGDPAAQLKAYLARREAHYRSFPLQLSTQARSPEQAAWEAQILLGMFRVRGMGAGYDVRVRPGGLDSVGEALRGRGLLPPLGLVTDENVGGLYAARVRRSLIEAGFPVRAITLPPGEAHKTVESVGVIWQGLLEAGVERRSTVAALGGGVVGDLAGFAAATFLRGVAWVVLPTTLLAMVDASLGGKTGADLPQGKNLVGAFHAPRLVLADPEVLATLPEAELRAGMAEVVKHGVIADPRLFAMCQEMGDLRGEVDWAELVARAMAVKIRVIEADPFEGGQRAALNLGHTIGHAVELVSGFRLRHGEAVAIGMVEEARLAERIGLAGKGLAEEIAGCLRGLGLPTEIPPGLSREAIRQAMRVDKKKAGGTVRFALPVRVGEVRVGVSVGSEF